MTDGATIWHLELMNYSDNAEALALAAEVARAVQAPGAPGTGTAYGTNQGGGPPLRTTLLGAGFTLAGAAVVVVGRFVSRPR